MIRRAARHLALIMLLALCGYANSKTRDHRHFDNRGAGRGHETVSRPSAAEIEKRFRPYLEHRIKNRQSGRRGPRPESFIYPTKNDFYSLWRVWDELSPQFHALYKEATDISRFKDFDSFISPKGKFQILYTTSGEDSVDVTDKFSYGSGQSWNVRSAVRNEVPDYIDEVAFALDSAYTMMVERFGFAPPIAAADPNGSTEYYTVAIARQGLGFYGVTNLDERASSRGFRSYIEINNDWSGPEWRALGYNERPYDALRVTGAHELFHAVQYAMVWDVRNYVLLDNFPLGWTEGSAVLMEDIAFPEVKDYLQYIEDYFSNPRITLLDRNVWSEFTYLNSILFKYLYEKTNPADGIKFLRDIYDNNYGEKNMPFHKNLEIVSKNQAEKTWAEVFNGFHAESFFTGKRARPWAFVTDSELMDTIRTPQPSSNSTTSSVRPYSAEFLWYTPQSHYADTLYISLDGQTDAAVAAVNGKTWAASMLVMERCGDSIAIVPLYMDQNGRGSFTLANWKDKKGSLLVVTNASPGLQKSITVKTENGGGLNVSPSVFPNVVSLKSAKSIRITGGKISDIRIFTIDGRLVGRWNGTSQEAFSQSNNKSVVEWTPGKNSGSKRLAPGTYFITAVSYDPVTSKKSSARVKVMITP